MEKRILVIDDEVFLTDLLGHFLTKGGYCVDKTSDSQEGLHLMEKNLYDLVLLDIKMPQVSGREFYQIVRERSPEMSGRIVFITGDVANRTTQHFIEGTGNLCLKKPFTLADIRGVLTRFFGEPEKPQ